VTLAAGDTKSILTAKRAIQGNVAMHVTHPVNLVVKFQTKAISAIWWQNIQTMLVVQLVAKFSSNASGAIWW